MKVLLKERFMSFLNSTRNPRNQKKKKSVHVLKKKQKKKSPKHKRWASFNCTQTGTKYHMHSCEQ